MYVAPPTKETEVDCACSTSSRRIGAAYLQSLQAALDSAGFR